MLLKRLLALTVCVAIMASLVWVTPVFADFNEGLAKTGTDDFGNYIAFGPKGEWGYTQNTNLWLYNNSPETSIIFGDYFVGLSNLKYVGSVACCEKADSWFALKAKPNTVLTRFDIDVSVGLYNETPRQDAKIEFFSDDAATALVHTDTVNGAKSFDFSQLGLANTVKSFKVYLYTGGSEDWGGSSCNNMKFWYANEIDESVDSLKITPTQVTAASGDTVNFTPELFGPNKVENAANLLWSVSNNLPGTSISGGVLNISPDEPNSKVLTVTAYVPDTELSATATVNIMNETSVEFNSPFTRDAASSAIFGSYYAGGGNGWSVNWDSQFFVSQTSDTWFAIKAEENRIISKVDFIYNLNGDGAYLTVSGYTDDAVSAGNENGYSATKNVLRGDGTYSVDILGSGTTNTKSVKIAYTYPGWALLQIKGIKVYFVPEPQSGSDEITLSYDAGVVTVTGDRIPALANLIVASYKGNRLLDAKVIYYGDDDVEGGIWTPVGFNSVGCDKVKVMLWDSVTQVPLVEAFDSSK